MLDHLDFLAEVVIVRDKENSPQPIIALAPNRQMDWDAWWKMVEDLPHLNQPILRDYEDIPRTATMKVQRLQIEKNSKTQNNAKTASRFPAGPFFCFRCFFFADVILSLIVFLSRYIL